ncbi:class C beta-lactamase-related serine hydrolase [Falsibacillus albus]|uniref:Class C beta-lactamase-related serine hydrolase n=2 Tax=Falsibacillus albus TaxID=2478915 RepID=A0A3L7JQ85_9BACI|nr:serine hydrolase [Falsibacillus albus]RLQ92435.1 class C beta-lactamase-related serine hydrolase [Falsibacillus albus]
MLAIDTWIQKKSKEHNLSGVVYLKQDKQVLSKSAFGFANRAEEQMNTVDTRFGIASGCKLFTAVGICQLVEKGILTFETLLVDCLDIDFPHFDKRITVHQLLTHTSGVPDYFDEEIMEDFEDLWKTCPVYQMKEPIDFLPLFQTKEMMFQPGEKFHYNNAGYILLGLIIEQQTGKNFSEFIESEIFCRCGMMDSGYFSMDQLPKNTALGYIEDKGSGALRTNIFAVPMKGGADGGAYVTALDMMEFWEALFDFRLVNEKLTSLIVSPLVQVKDEVDYGYGIWINKRNNRIFKYHVMGYDPGVNFRSSVYPELGIKLALPCNSETGAFELTKSIEEYIDKNWGSGGII